MKHIRLFENFIENRYGEDVEVLSQIITFSLTDKARSYFDHDTWIKKWETDLERKPDDSDIEERIKKVGDVRYLLDEFQVYFYYYNLLGPSYATHSRLRYGPNKKIDTWSNKEYKDYLLKIWNLWSVDNPYSDENAEKLLSFETEFNNIKDLVAPTGGESSPNAKTFLVGYGTVQSKERIESEWGHSYKLTHPYERYNYYCLVTVVYSNKNLNGDDSIELWPSKILVKSGDKPGMDEVITTDKGIWCKIEREEWQRGLKSGDTDHRGFFRIDSVEDYQLPDMKDARKKD